MKPIYELVYFPGWYSNVAYFGVKMGPLGGLSEVGSRVQKAVMALAAAQRTNPNRVVSGVGSTLRNYRLQLAIKQTVDSDQ